MYNDTECLETAKETPEWQSALADLKFKNSVVFELEQRFSLPFEYQIVSKLNEVGGVRFPPADVVYGDFIKQQMEVLEKWSEEGYSQVAVSAPGISSDGGLAIVYVGISFAGYFWELHRSGSLWVVFPKPHCGWIS